MVITDRNSHRKPEFLQQGYFVSAWKYGERGRNRTFNLLIKSQWIASSISAFNRFSNQ